MRSIVIVAAALLMCSCGTLSTPKAPTDPESYGSPIERQAAEALASAWLSSSLRDPGSAQTQWLGIDRFFTYNGLNDIFIGYGLDARVNSTNGFGGMTGPQPFTFVFFNGELRHVFGLKYQKTFNKRVRSRLWSGT